MAGRALAVWVALLGVAIANGAFREVWLIPRVGDRTGHQISTVLLATAIVLVTLMAVRWLAPATTAQVLGIGAGWVVMTLAFEFLVGHYVGGTPWQDLLADYDVLHGRIWILVLAATGAAPWIAASIRGLTHR